MSNVIDRAIVDVYTNNIVPMEQTINAVVDYLSFSFINGSAIFNMPDVFVEIFPPGIKITVFFIQSFNIFAKVSVASCQNSLNS